MNGACLVFPKGSSEKVGCFFTAKEFDCPCDHCSFTFIDPGLVTLLDRLRDLIGESLIIDRGGGYRCDWYQNNLRERGYETSVGRSQHQEGKAADVSSPGRTGADLGVFAAEAGFHAIGTASNWTHLDIRPAPERRWSYARHFGTH